MTQPNILELAKQGDEEAIASVDEPPSERQRHCCKSRSEG
jgi:hypothetical protein